MTQRRNNRRVMNGDGEWTYRCSMCREYKTDCHFHSDNSKPPFNLSYNCKECRRGLKERDPYLKDWEVKEGKKVLEIIGYNINENIHQQFIMKLEMKYGVIL